MENRFLKARALLSAAFMSFAVVLAAASCASPPSETTCTPEQIAKAIIASQEKISVLHPVLPDDDYFFDYVSEIYRVNYYDIEDGAIYYTAGMLADEIAVFLVDADAEIDSIKRMFEYYISLRLAAFTGYAPDQAAILENGKVVANGSYVALLICEDVSSAQSAFLACFGENPPSIPDTIAAIAQPSPIATPEPPPTADVARETPDAAEEPTEPAIDVYDPDAILAAWVSGDASGLTALNKSVFEVASEVISILISDGMSDLEKELAIHDWIIDWAGYDTEANNNAPDAAPDPNNDNPYGLLINGKAICTGYAYTFQLLMDMLGIECITVHGIAVTGGEHAWNMVRIDGEWYCVDVTWNDPTNVNALNARTARHKHFNVPSQFLRDQGHQWDESSTPEATAPKLMP